MPDPHGAAEVLLFIDVPQPILRFNYSGFDDGGWISFHLFSLRECFQEPPIPEEVFPLFQLEPPLFDLSVLLFNDPPSLVFPFGP